ncbi:hypothetical protein LEP1GSC035_0583 [Leptospira noguchii str. 2007001578]|uniref:Transposase IS4-like domain-containing protein n=1 Tax=Leptospira noguchii str. 2007001578 TaxID=1049974 RepID=A0ABP2T219_9LEPT|nr:hypothetical protein LEP1GSC035_0583 [Leptospira noguchii str. 2007001578]
MGVKRHILTDGNGIPLAITLSGANVHDKHNVKETLNSILIFSGRRKRNQNIFVLIKDMTSKIRKN